MALTHNDTNGAAVASSPAWLAESVRAIEPDLQHRFEGYLGAIGDVRAASNLDRGGDFLTKWIRPRGSAVLSTPS